MFNFTHSIWGTFVDTISYIHLHQIPFALSAIPPSLPPSLLSLSLPHSRPPSLHPSSLTHARTNSRTHTTVYGKFYKGKLIVETDDMQWTYDVIGEHPHYDPPQVSRKVCINDFMCVSMKLSVCARTRKVGDRQNRMRQFVCVSLSHLYFAIPKPAP